MKHATVTRNFAKYVAAALVATACTVKEPLDIQAPIIPEPVLSVDNFSVTAEFSDALIEQLEAPATKASVMEGLGIKRMERVFRDGGEFEARRREMGLHRFYRVEFEENATKASLEGRSGVISIDTLRRIHKRASFNDPYGNYQWDIVGSSYSAADIGVSKVWDLYTTGSSSVIVAVVDEPVDPTHKDLNFWKDASGHTGYNFAKDSWDLSIEVITDDSGEDIGDIGHGTHIAGTISAINNNNRMGCGMAGGDYASGVRGALVMSCAIFSGTEYGDEGEAITWAADHGAVICQNSWGFSADSDGDGTVSSSELASYKRQTIPSYLKRAIDYFIRYAGCDASGNQLQDSPMKGGLVFFAAGNEGIDYDPVCDYEPVIAVGAFDYKGKAASYSNWGSWVDIAAPGGDGANDDDWIWSTFPVKLESSGFAGMIGTSMACPHAAGAAALIVSHFGKSGFTADKCKEILFGGLGDKIGGTKSVGKKLDVYQAFKNVVPNHPPTVAGSIEDMVISGLKQREGISLDGVFADEDNDELTYSVSMADSGTATGSTSSEMLYITSVAYGVTSFTVTATDPLGESVTCGAARVAVVNPDEPVSLSPSVASSTTSISVPTVKPVSVAIVIYNSAGAKVHEGSISASAFEAATIDISKLAPGRYALTASWESESYTTALVKY